MMCSKSLKSLMPVVALGVMTLGFASTSAFASTAVSNAAQFNVSATVVTGCATSVANPLAFGSLMPTTVQVQATTNLTINCANADAYTIGLNAALGTGATDQARLMQNGAHTLAYTMYFGSYTGTNWGTTTAGSRYGGTGTGAAQTVPIYGVASPTASTSTGTYSDTITVDITY